MFIEAHFDLIKCMFQCNAIDRMWYQMNDEFYVWLFFLSFLTAACLSLNSTYFFMQKCGTERWWKEIVFDVKEHEEEFCVFLPLPLTWLHFT